MKDSSSDTRLGNYELIAEIGSGGMGRVYRARDTVLGREVAIKRLDDDALESDSARMRFAQEARSLATIKHPNVAQLFEFSDENPPWLAMELIQGAALSERIDKGAIPARETVLLARDIAAGMAAAHAAGVLHRDLKPANVIVHEDGTAKLLDFGLAKITGSSELTQVPSMTVTGQLIGTFPYLSPEELQGDPATARSDIWSFGCVLYEMLTGVRAFEDESSPALATRILRGDPDWEKLEASASARMVNLVRRCLSREPERRPLSFERLVKELDVLAAKPIEATLLSRTLGRWRRGAAAVWRRPGTRLALLGAALLVLLFGSRPWRFLPESAVPVAGPVEAVASGRGFVLAERSEAPRLAVLPLRPQSGSVDASLGSALAGVVATRLTGLEGLQVLGNESALRYEDPSQPLDEIARELEAKYLVTGTLSTQSGAEGRELHAVTTLVELPGERELWSERYQAAEEDLLELQVQIAEDVAERMGIALEAGDLEALRTIETRSLPAFRANKRGREICDQPTPNELERGRELMRLAIEEDPTWASPWLGLARCNYYAWLNGIDDSRDNFEAVPGFIAEAEALSGETAESVALLGMFHLVNGDQPAALQILERAYAMDPQSVDANFYLGAAYLEAAELVGADWKLGHELMARSVELNPFDIRRSQATALYHSYTRDPGTAETMIRALEAGRDGGPGLTLRQALVLQGKLEGLNAVSSPVLVRINKALYERDPASVEALLADIAQAPPGAPVGFDGLGSRASVMALLLELVPNPTYGEAGELWLEAIPELEALHGDPQFQGVFFQRSLRSYLAHALAATGERERAIALAEELSRGPKYPGFRSGLMAHVESAAKVYARLGEAGRCVELLRVIWANPSPISLAWLKIHPAWDPIRDSQEFQNFLREYEGVRIAPTRYAPR